MMTIDYKPYKEPLREVTDGFGYMGTIGRSRDGLTVQCHICGGMFKALGVHAAKKHGVGEHDYRRKFGLASSTPLVSQHTRERYVLASATVPSAVLIQRLENLQNGRHDGRSKTYYSKSLEQKNIEGRCPDQIIDKIQQLAAILGKTPSLREFRTHYKGMVKITYDTFGSWSNAVKIAGLDEAATGRGAQYTKPILRDMVRNFWELNGRRPYTGDTKAGLLPSMWTFKKHFGSFSNAIREAMA